MSTFICPSCKQPNSPKVRTAFLGHKNVTCTKCGAVARYPMSWGIRIVLWGFTVVLGIALLNGHFSFIFPLCVIGCIFDLFLLVNAPTASSDPEAVAQPDSSATAVQPGARPDAPPSAPVVQPATAEPFRPESPPEEPNLGHILIGLFLPFVGLPMGVKRLKQGQRDISMRLILVSVWFGLIWIVVIVALILNR
jgi:hypothetical protein